MEVDVGLGVVLIAIVLAVLVITYVWSPSRDQQLRAREMITLLVGYFPRRGVRAIEVASRGELAGRADATDRQGGPSVATFVGFPAVSDQTTGAESGDDDQTA